MRITLLLALAWLLTACETTTSDGGSQLDPNVAPITNGSWYQPPLAAIWQMQLTATVNTSYSVDLYVIDMFDATAALISTIQASGAAVICYYSAGTYENWRPDFAKFRASDLGLVMSGWPDEQWLDIRSANVQAIMMARMDTAKQKGCDGVAPDNLDGYAHNTGFPLTATDQIAYDRFIANEAHKRNLAVASKNDISHTPQVVDYFDLAINEQCFAMAECDFLTPFITAGKPVLNVEFDSLYVNDAVSRQAMCTDSLNRQFSTLVLPWLVNDSFRFSCR